MNHTAGRDGTTHGKKVERDVPGHDPAGKDVNLSGSLRHFYDRWMAPQGEDGHYTIVHDVVLACIIVVIIVCGIYLYTRTWPPVVVVESGSMQHSMDRSALGVIDTGDIVLVKRVDSERDITPWSVGKLDGHKTYGHYGDVIIYDKNGEGGTPVIHRAIVFIRHNETEGGVHYFDVPEWGIFHERTITYYIDDLDLQINYTPPRGHSGYLTKGDNPVTNRKIDQESGITDAHGSPVTQISVDWVIGVARGEVPWFGLIKLNLNNNPGYDSAPANSRTNLKISVFLLLGVPIILNVMYYYAVARYAKMENEDAEGSGRSGAREKDSGGGSRSSSGSGSRSGSGSSSDSGSGSGSHSGSGSDSGKPPGGRDGKGSGRMGRVKIGKGGR